MICLLFTTSIFFSCSKDDHQASTATHQILDLQSHIDEKMNSLSSSEIVQGIEKVKSLLNEDLQLNLSESEAIIPLENLFIYHQGALNSIYTAQLNSEDEVVEFYFFIDLPILDLGNQSYAFETEDINHFYSSISSHIDIQLDGSIGEYLILSSFELHSLNGQMATIKVGLIKAIPQFQFFSPIPIETIKGAGKLEYCSANNTSPQSFDASDIIEYHLNELSKQRTTCDSGKTRHIVAYKGKFQTINPGAFFTNLQNPGAFLSQYYYMENGAISCIGDNNDQSKNDSIWNSYFQNAYFLPDNIINNNFPNDSVFWFAPILDSKSPYTGNCSLFGFQHYHTGTFYFYKLICI